MEVLRLLNVSKANSQFKDIYGTVSEYSRECKGTP
jgi:hypothetical protein